MGAAAHAAYVRHSERKATTMSNYPVLPPIGPLDDDDETTQPLATREVDDERILDPDADDDLIDSAEADRLATTADDEDTD